MKFAFSLVILFLLQACKHPLAIVGQGDIVERNAGVRGCTYEEFQAQSTRCAENDVADVPYQVSYEAIPREGWVFKGWKGTACSPESQAPYCEHDITEAWVNYTNVTWPDFGFPATVAVFEGTPLGCSEWSTPSVPTSNHLTAFASNGSIALAGGTDGIFSSPDGLTWTPRLNSYIQEILWDGSQFVAASHESFYVSTNGIDWDVIVPDFPEQEGFVEFVDLAFDGSTYLTTRVRFERVDGEYQEETSIYTSADLVAWMPRHLAENTRVNDATWTGSQFIAVGWNETIRGLDGYFEGRIFSSPDGINWSVQTPSDMSLLHGVGANGEVVLIGNNLGKIFSSTDGANWVEIDSRLAPEPAGRITTIDWTGKEFIAAGDRATIWSEDGVSWAPWLGQPDAASFFDAGVHQGNIYVVGYAQMLGSDCSGR